jgi:hypothetical protein
MVSTVFCTWYVSLSSIITAALVDSIFVMKPATSNLLCYEFSAIGTLCCVARSGLVSSSQIAGQDGVRIALRTIKLGRGVSGETQR